MIGRGSWSCSGRNKTLYFSNLLLSKKEESVVVLCRRACLKRLALATAGQGRENFGSIRLAQNQVFYLMHLVKQVVHLSR